LILYKIKLAYYFVLIISKVEKLASDNRLADREIMLMRRKNEMMRRRIFLRKENVPDALAPTIATMPAPLAFALIRMFSGNQGADQNGDQNVENQGNQNGNQGANQNVENQGNQNAENQGNQSGNQGANQNVNQGANQNSDPNANPGVAPDQNANLNANPGVAPDQNANQGPNHNPNQAAASKALRYYKP
jgi:hypothetical protein